MPLSIKDPQADKLARDIAQMTGETLTQAVIGALRERLDRESGKKRESVETIIGEIMELVKDSSCLPLLDSRSPDEILGYNQYGIPE